MRVLEKLRMETDAAMSKKLIVVYDNTAVPGEHFQDIIGDSSYADVIFERKTFRQRMYEQLMATGCVEKILSLDHPFYFDRIKRQINLNKNDCRILHLYSYTGVRDTEEFTALLQKLQYSINDVFYIATNVLFYFFSDAEAYIEKMDSLYKNNLNYFQDGGKIFENVKADCFYDFSFYSEFLKYISGGFQARYFNSLVADEYVVTKRSSDKNKMKKEYTYYYLLPPEMQAWCVLPFDYREEAEYASYSMERYGVTDMAIKWVHQSINLQEFEQFLKKAFMFITSRPQKSIEVEAYRRIQDQLYMDKVKQRLETLKKHVRFQELEAFLTHVEGYAGIDDVFCSYYQLYEKIQVRCKPIPVLSIGHGDFCFSNILYDKQTHLMRLIDPKGALEEKELWTDPYYDIAKLSHSICGLYDLFNSGLFDITVNDDMKLVLNLDHSREMQAYRTAFQQALEQNGFSYLLTRIYEASLFLSMLPLHMDNPKKVLGFLLNAINIMKEIQAEAGIG